MEFIMYLEPWQQDLEDHGAKFVKGMNNSYVVLPDGTEVSFDEAKEYWLENIIGEQWYPANKLFPNIPEGWQEGDILLASGNKERPNITVEVKRIVHDVDLSVYEVLKPRKWEKLKKYGYHTMIRTTQVKFCHKGEYLETT